MNANLKSSKRRNERATATFSRTEFDLTKDEIVNLSLAQIHEMSREELIALICLADVPLLHGEPMEHLPYSDEDTLRRLAFLAQRTLQHQADYGNHSKK